MSKRLVFELKKIKKEHQGHTILNVKHLECHPGTIYGIIGPMGAGKTTLLKILSGRETPSSGEVLFEGERFQKNWWGKLKPIKDIWFGSIDELDSNKLVSNVLPDTHVGFRNNKKDSYFTSKSQQHLLSEIVGNLSQGEKVWLLKCMLQNQDPRVVIFDDYGVYLNQKREIELQKLLINMNKELGTTLILGCNDDRSIKNFASVLIYFNHGHISKIRPGKSVKKNQRRR